MINIKIGEVINKFNITVKRFKNLQFKKLFFLTNFNQNKIFSFKYHYDI